MTAKQLFDNRYELGTRLGEGFSARIYRARNIHPDWAIPEDVALKIFKSSLPDAQGTHARFEDEAAIMKVIVHDQIVRVYDARTTAAGDIRYLVMQHIEGQDLHKHLLAQRLSWKQARLVLECLTEAVEYLHQRTIVHGDIKPSNIMLDKHGDLAYLLDLGLARVIGYESLCTQPDRDEEGRPQMPPGTIYYMAPELWQGQEPTIATDLYAFAATVFEIFTGKRLFEPPVFSYQELIERHCNRAPDLEPLEQLGLLELIPAFQKALQKRPEYRYRSVREFQEALMRPESGGATTPTWGLQEVPRNAAVRVKWKLFGRPGKIHDICAAGAYVWAATDAGVLQWRQQVPRLFTIADGLPHSYVTALTVNHGNLWIGTADGLCWGERAPFKNVHELLGTKIRKVSAAPNGDRIWVGLESGNEIASVDRWGERFVRHTLSQDIDIKPPSALYVEPDGRRIWVALPDRVIRLDALGREQQVFYNGDYTSFPKGEVLDLVGTSDHRIWVLTSERLACYREGQWLEAAWAGASPGTSLKSCGGDVWVGSNKGLLHYNATRRETETFLEAKDIQAYAAQQDCTYIARPGQLLAYYPDGHLRESLLPPPAPLDNDVQALATGEGQTLWVGSRKGVTQLRDGKWIEFPLTARASGRRYGWERGPVTALAISTYDQMLFGVVRNRHLLRLEAGLWEEVFFPLEVTHIHTLLAGKAGMIWIGTDAGLWQIGPQSGRAEHIAATASTSVLSLAQLGDELWLGTDVGALRLNAARQLRRENLLAHRILALHGAFDGTVWAGTSEGAFRLANGRWAALPDLRSHKVNAITQTRDGALWFGTSQGCLRFDGLGVMSANKENRRLPEDTVRAIAESADGTLWVATKGGLVHFQS
ncbi:MAG: protein kinase [Anaerolineae bacterium]|nr:protein kinase [Anaerolineae bacterium]